MYHSVPVEEMVAGDGLVERVGPISDVYALDALRDSPRHREGLPDGLLRDGGEVAGDLDAGVGGLRKRMLPLVRHQGRLHHVEGQRRRPLQQVQILR